MTSSATETLVKTEITDGILRIVWNRPEKKNALTGAMYAAYHEALGRAADDPAVRVVLVTGEGSAFTAGNDLQDFATWGAIGDVEDLPVIRAIRRTLAFPKPLVAAVRGPAVGFGTTLLLHCDAVVAGDSATFALPFTRLGLVPEFGSTYVLPLMAGRVRAAHHLLLGEPFGRDEAKELGLVSLACADAAVDEQAMGLCRKLAALPPATLRTAKALIDAPERRAALEAAIDAEAKAFVAGLSSPEHAEAVRAFMEKRPPKF